VIRSAGITDIVLDPGLGFGKSVDQNFILLKGLGVFRFLELPLMIGLSRKSMVWRTLDISPDEALNGTTALHMIALQQGVRILRVHDVRAACEAIALHQRLSQA
jgi:dihydropteroate synthase